MKRTLATLAAAGAALLVAACGGSEVVSGTPGSGATSTVTKGAAPAGVPADGAVSSTAAGMAPVPAAGSPQGAAAPANTVAPLPPVPVGGTGKLVRTALMTVEVPNGKFDDALTAAFSLATREGGVVSGSDASNGGDNRIRTGTVRLSIPSDKLDEAIAELRGMGTVQAFHVDAQDVGAQYVDLNARLKNAESQRDAFLALMEQARTVGDIVNIQNQLGQVEAQIEQLKGQISYLDHATSFSTLTVTFREHGVAPVSPPADDWGTRTAFVQGIHWFVAGLNFFIVLALAAGPWVLLGAGAMYLAWRRRRAVPPVQPA